MNNPSGPTEHTSKISEQSADISVEAARLNTDVASFLARGEADASRLFGRQTSKEISRVERRKTDESIKRERQWSDDALASERSARRSGERHAASELSAERRVHAMTREALAKELELTQVICHDLRNPIGAISTCAEMLLADLGAGSVARDLKEWLTFIKRNADAALRLAIYVLDGKQTKRGKLSIGFMTFGY